MRGWVRNPPGWGDDVWSAIIANLIAVFTFPRGPLCPIESGGNLERARGEYAECLTTTVLARDSVALSLPLIPHR